jgi:hypothetical protein
VADADGLRPDQDLVRSDLGHAELQDDRLLRRLEHECFHAVSFSVISSLG